MSEMEVGKRQKNKKIQRDEEKRVRRILD